MSNQNTSIQSSNGNINRRKKRKPSILVMLLQLQVWILIVMLTISIIYTQKTVSGLNEQINSITENYQSNIDNITEDYCNDVESLITSISDLTTKISDLENKISEIEGSIDTINAEIKEQNEIRTAEAAEAEAIAQKIAIYADVPLSDDVKNYIYEAAMEAEIPPEILFSMGKLESEFNPNAVSSTNDHGLFQINKCNFSTLSERFGYTLEEFSTAIYDPYVNTDCAISLLTELRDNYRNDNWHHVLMRYNLGPGGANNKFAEGIYSNSYSNAIINYAKQNFNLDTIKL